VSAVRVEINGAAREIPGGLTVEAMLRHLELEPRLVVVERNGEILRRDGYAGAVVEEGDRYELVHFVGGG
jgi:sulfur carrier protein